MWAKKCRFFGLWRGLPRVLNQGTPLDSRFLAPHFDIHSAAIAAWWALREQTPQKMFSRHFLLYMPDVLNIDILAHARYTQNIMDTLYMIVTS